MKNPDYQDMARAFMDLWQKQMGSVVRDKPFIEAMLDMTQNWQNAYGTTGKTSAPRPSRASADDNGDLAQLAFRIGMCEERLARLESGAAKRPVRRSKKPRR